MELNDGVTKAEVVVSATYGAVVVRITLYDRNGNALQEQPRGRFQVWQVTGEVKLLKPCSSPEEAESFLKDASQFHQIDADERFDVERLESEAARHQVADPRDAMDCRIDLVFVENGAEELLAAQFKRRQRKCIMGGDGPLLLDGLSLEQDPPSSDETILRPTRPKGL